MGLSSDFRDVFWSLNCGTQNLLVPAEVLKKSLGLAGKFASRCRVWWIRGWCQIQEFVVVGVDFYEFSKVILSLWMLGFTKWNMKFSKFEGLRVEFYKFRIVSVKFYQFGVVGVDFYKFRVDSAEFYEFQVLGVL